MIKPVKYTNLQQEIGWCYGTLCMLNINVLFGIGFIKPVLCQ